MAVLQQPGTRKSRPSYNLVIYGPFYGLLWAPTVPRSDFRFGPRATLYSETDPALLGPSPPGSSAMLPLWHNGSSHRYRKSGSSWDRYRQRARDWALERQDSPTGHWAATAAPLPSAASTVQTGGAGAPEDAPRPARWTQQTPRPGPDLAEH
jgi:hypothetical protein